MSPWFQPKNPKYTMTLYGRISALKPQILYCQTLTTIKPEPFRKP